VAYSVRIRVRYNECDLQGIVFNANYLIYVDETLDRWITDRLGEDAIDMVVKKATVEWHSPARRGDVIELVPQVSRWGTTSYDVTVDGSVDGRPVFTATMVYINVVPGSKTPTPMAPDQRAILDRDTVSVPVVSTLDPGR
jgi:acyl-CoA thioester hydrolase